MNWKDLNNVSQLEELRNTSYNKPQVIFKHSTRCSISVVAKSRLDKQQTDALDFWYLDLLNFREISKQIAEKFSVNHESPQVLLIKNGECIFDESHGSIYFDEIVTEALK